MEIDERILQIRDFFCDGSNRKFAEKIGINEKYISNIAHGGRNASKKVLDKITDVFPEVNKSWLYFGEGSMLKNNNTGDISNNHAGGDILGNGAVKTTPENDTTIAEQITKLIDLLSTTK